MNTYLTRTPSSTGNLRTFTISFWVKKCLQNGGGGTSQQIIGQTNEQYFRLMFLNNTDQFRFYDQAGMSKMTTRKFRDTNAWYHFCVRIDTTQGTAANRCRLYVNGVQETSFSTDTNPGQNVELHFNRQHIHSIGRSSSSGGYDYLNGSLSDFMVVDGQSLPPTSFGETDTSTGEWRVKELESNAFTWGTNGFRILKDGMTVTDQSTNSNNWSASGSLTKTEDSPSNVFATWNPLMPQSATYSNGNTSVNQTADASYRPIYSTIATPTTGKFYAEFKAVSGFDNINKAVGFIDVDLPFAPTAHIESYSTSGSYGANGRASYNGTADTSVPQYTNGDIIGIALDLDNGKSYFHKNGTYINSGNPTTGSNGYTVTTGKSYAFVAIVINQAGSNLWSANFGNGYFGTTTVASAGTNASGNGIFEYDVPTGFTALSTKGLNL
jgi:hypothetical protein